MSYLSDSNEELIETYIAIKNHPQEVIQILQGFENNEDRYYQIRAMEPRDATERAAFDQFKIQVVAKGVSKNES